ncbi:unnamed protein product [Closterium sp. Naga37s-1]|nr:unnamed protein product [Closterium sp. Naga37s-1]
MTHTSLRPAFVFAVLLCLACGAIAGRHLLQTSNTRYQIFPHYILIPWVTMTGSLVHPGCYRHGNFPNHILRLQRYGRNRGGPDFLLAFLLQS